MDRKRPPTFSVDGLTRNMDFQTFRRERSASEDRFLCEVRWDSCYGVARSAAPCTEQRGAKQGLLHNSILQKMPVSKIRNIGGNHEIIVVSTAKILSYFSEKAILQQPL